MSWPETRGTVRATDEGGVLPDDPGEDPRFRKLVEGILFGRRFVLTYNVALLGVLVVFTAWHWGEKFTLRRKRRDARRKEGEDEGFDELQYQPKPIPIINKTLPTNAISLFVLTYIGLNIFYNFYNMPMDIQYVFVFADRCGLIFSANLPILYLLAAKNQPIKFLTGYSYESLNIFHRRVGELMCLGTFLSYEAIYFTSLGSFRQRMYEIFLITHILLQNARPDFLWFHYHTSRPYVGISLAIFLIDRLVYRLWLKSTSHPATLTSDDDEHAWFSLLIRAQATSGFTRTLLDYARTHRQTRIRLDGPYGSSHALDVLSSSDTAIVVAGGSGIAVAYPLLYALLQPLSRDLETALSKKSTKKVKLMWIVHSASHREWLPHDKIKELQDWGLEILIPMPTEVAGRPDVPLSLGKWADDSGETGVVVSGPDTLVRDVRNTCAGLIAQGEDVRVQVEKFGW
ncbi:hypothetical protein CC80DRAFT_514289 [Byssothecium circinans]|uniref:Ferric oxidoreductase domain-containing protein n=1 Tax=Byssothecium circinans TaxID=147558 RepID=A0A6A5U595_9PLEO|nr:hypothetical protein CC80DRAFT_514289 [Byssothecium circinans]